MQFGYRQANFLITHARHLKNILIEQGYSEKKIEVIPHPLVIEPDKTHVDVTEANTILFFGRIWEYKGLEYLIKAQPLVSEVIPNAKFIIAGTGEDFDRYEAMMHDSTKFEVHYRYISNEERITFFKRASIVCLPYIDATISGVIPIAYAFAKPVVATRVGGLTEMVEDGQTGRLVNPYNSRELAEAIIDILSNDKLRNTMEKNALRKTTEEWNIDTLASRTMEVYEHTLNLK
jgi:starch synthase